MNSLEKFVKSGILYVDEGEDSLSAVRLLRGSGYYIVTVPIEGLPEVKFRVGSTVYYGIEEIKSLIYKNNRK